VNASALLMGSSLAQEAENIAVLVSVRKDVEALVRRVALLKGELAEACQAREVAKEKVCDLSSSSIEGSRRLATSEAGHREQPRSFPFYVIGAPSCASPYLVHHW
jgi:hypothetical protein